MIAFVMPALFLILGILMVAFARRAATLVNTASLSIFKIAPWLNFSGKSQGELLGGWTKSRLHIFEDFWVWSVRIMGVIFVIFDLVVLYALIR
jgi:hypothetical protein